MTPPPRDSTTRRPASGSRFRLASHIASVWYSRSILADATMSPVTAWMEAYDGRGGSVWLRWFAASTLGIASREVATADKGGPAAGGERAQSVFE